MNGKRDMRSKAGKAAAVLMSLAMVFGAACPAFAASSSPKEEVIYVKTDATGVQKSVNAVNIFGPGSITDYGDYSEVRLMNSNAEMTHEGDKVSFETDGRRVYYQGTMDPATNIPWDISIHYYLSGAEVTPGELAGASGSLQISLSVKDDPSFKNKTYFNNYAIQAVILLDTELCSDIYAPDATVANVGSSKQLTYTVLPGKGIETSIAAQVHDFEMDAIAINGIALNLNVDLDDEELLDKVRELMTAVRKLNNGAAELADGTSDAEAGAEDLLSGTKDLHSGVSDLDNGLKDLQSGIAQIQTGLDELDSNTGSLTSGSAQVKEALETIQEKLGEIETGEEQLAQLDELIEANTKAITSLNTLSAAIENVNAPSIDDDSLSNTIALLQEIAASGTDEQKAKVSAALGELSKLKETAGGAGEQLAALKGKASLLSNATQLLKNDNEAITKLKALLAATAELKDGIDDLVTQYEALDAGIISYTEGLGEIIEGYGDLVKGVSSLASGSSDLLEGAGALESGTADLYEGVSELCDGAEKLAKGTDKLYSKTSDMDDKVQDEIDEILDSLGGDDFEAVSFTSEKNTDVRSVQFVIKTDPIETASGEETETEKDTNQNFLQRLIGLFTKKG